MVRASQRSVVDGDAWSMRRADRPRVRGGHALLHSCPSRSTTTHSHWVRSANQRREAAVLQQLSTAIFSSSGAAAHSPSSRAARIRYHGEAARRFVCHRRITVSTRLLRNDC